MLPCDLRKELCYFLNPVTLSLIVQRKNIFGLGYCLNDDFWANKIKLDILHSRNQTRYDRTHFESSQQSYIAYWTTLHGICSKNGCCYF